MFMRKCTRCGVVLTQNDNWSNSCIKKHMYICTPCNSKRTMKWQAEHRDRYLENRRQHKYRHGGKPMSENKECTSYLGVHIAERVLSMVFKDVEVMPYGHSGYDFICNKGKKIDVKSGCLNKDGRWTFNICKNTVADCFLCLAFDNREDLNPMFIWLLPGSVVNSRRSVTVSMTTTQKWDRYKLCIDDVVKCCDNKRDSR